MVSKSYADVFARLPVDWKNNKTQLANFDGGDLWVAFNPEHAPMFWRYQSLGWMTIKFEDRPFELKFDIRQTNVKDEFNSYGNSFGMAEVTTKAVQEIQEWIHAQENK